MECPAHNPTLPPDLYRCRRAVAILYIQRSSFLARVFATPVLSLSSNYRHTWTLNSDVFSPEVRSHHTTARDGFIWRLPSRPVRSNSWRERWQSHGVSFEGEMGGHAVALRLYFRDPDGHLVELANAGLWSIY